MYYTYYTITTTLKYKLYYTHYTCSNVQLTKRMSADEMIRKHKRTNIFLINEDLWAWAQYRAKTLGYESTSYYIFDLIKLDKEKDMIKKHIS